MTFAAAMQRGAAHRLASLLRSASASELRGLKTETGIVGLAVDPQARKHLRDKILSVLDTIQTIPETAEYRKNVESTFSSRSEIRFCIYGQRFARGT